MLKLLTSPTEMLHVSCLMHTLYTPKAISAYFDVISHTIPQEENNWCSVISSLLL